MSQDNLIKLVSLGDENGKGKGHIIWSHKNAKKLRGIKIELKKFNPIAKKHTVYLAIVRRILYFFSQTVNQTKIENPFHI